MRRLALIALFFVVGLILWPGLADAQGGRRYHYPAIDYQITVNEDTTFDVIERQTYSFRGSYHQGWRDIPLNKISDIDVLSVVDGLSNKPLAYSSEQLDKLDPSSWGKYTVFRQDGAVVIEWYYNLANTTHDWVLKYRVHGGLSFLSDKDELYWNLFTDYKVPVNEVSAIVFLPANRFTTNQLSTHAYSNQARSRNEILDFRTARFHFYGAQPGEDVTIAFGWPRGLVDRGVFWRWWFQHNWAYLLSILIVLVTALHSLIRWYQLERAPLRSRTIVPEYEPPEKLKPAMAELIVKERMSNRAWAATVVDLAVRGHVEVEEMSASKVWQWFSKNARPIFWGLIIIFLALLVVGSASDSIFSSFGSLVPFIMAPVFLLLIMFNIAIRFGGKAGTYRLAKTGATADDLEDYEKEFLSLLFRGRQTVSTKDLSKRSRSASSGFRSQMFALRKRLYKETTQDTQAYEVPLRTWNIPAVALVFLLVWAAVFFGGLASALGGPVKLVILAISVLTSLLWLWQFKYNPRLSPRGVKLKQDWLGFILYLKTAEKYRLQNLTPELFEKYLPYAMIFGVEKKWGKAFESLHMQAPGWYRGTVSSGHVSAGTVGAFSASAFSASLSSSFASAFSSSSGGASGGGGGAGGGGGGGGGGAS
ncbi:MAG: DUF2207 domain-containing protein [Patescibacteria group bacterium]|nr:DUF2207 domain-containing protein [Patescibacteria group bacterium]